MTGRKELKKDVLEFAAKAAGLTYRFNLRPEIWIGEGVDEANYPTLLWRCWNPVYEDGDALRLANAAGLIIFIDKLQKCTRVKWCAAEEVVEFWHWNENQGADAATRTAIALAAAEIGRAMP
jgi:hypothetical protein